MTTLLGFAPLGIAAKGNEVRDTGVQISANVSNAVRVITGRYRDIVGNGVTQKRL